MSYTPAAGGDTTEVIKHHHFWLLYAPQSHGAVNFETSVGGRITLPSGKYKITQFGAYSGGGSNSINTFVRIKSDGREVVNSYSPSVGSSRTQLAGYAPNNAPAHSDASFGIGTSLTDDLHPKSLYIEGDLEIVMICTLAGGASARICIEELI